MKFHYALVGDGKKNLADFISRSFISNLRRNHLHHSTAYSSGVKPKGLGAQLGEWVKKKPR